jgi:hypothetical protein
MRTFASSSLAIGFLFLSMSAAAETRKVSNVSYGVSLDQGQVIDLPSGKKVRVGMRSHSSVVEDKTREEFSQWCTSEAQLDPAGKPTIEVGYCALLADNGDVLWLSFFNPGPGKATWAVIGGTGQYEGATGSGTSADSSQRGDGYAWTLKSSGTITTK